MGRGQAVIARDQFSMIFGDRRGLRAGQEAELFAPRQEGQLNFAIFSPGAEQVERILRVLKWWGPGSKVEFTAATFASDVPAYGELDDPEMEARNDLMRLAALGICKEIGSSLPITPAGPHPFTSYALRNLGEWPEEHRLIFATWASE